MGRRSRSRSRSRSKERKSKSNRSSSTSVRGGSGGGSSSKRRGSGRSDKDTSSNHNSSSNSLNDSGDRRGSSRSGAGGSKGGGKGDSRDRSVDRKGDSSSRRHEGRDRDRDRERDRDRNRDRNHHPRDAWSSRRNGRDGDERDERDRKRSRGSGRRDDDGDRGRGDERGRENPDDMWKRKLRDEDEQLKELDLDELMVDEEEEERRLEEQRKERREKLQALQQRKKDEEEQARKEAAEAAEAATAAAAASAGNGASDTTHDETLHADDRLSPPPPPSNGDPAIDNATSMLLNSVVDDGEEDADDAGPIEITKQAAGSDGGSNEGGAREEEDGNDDESGARNDAPIPGEGMWNGKPAHGSGRAGAGGGLSSSELRAQRGKEDRPVFDMFSAASPSAAAAGAGPGGKMGGKGGGHGMSYLGDDGGGDQGNWTDVEGYYKTRVGEVIGGRYTVLGSVGQGVFSTVLKCLDTRAGPAAVRGASEVALKMIRNNDTMRKAAQKEISLLKELAEHDPTNRKHCIRLLCSLEHKQHVVMVFEAMQMNLRETLKKFGRKTGINIHAVQKYAKQLMAALKHMASRNLVHADIKPDNILVDQGFGSLKLADFGSAFRESDPDNDPTPYLVSRWYRAPEIVMGLEYDKAIDLWSVAVTLFELYKGSPILPGVNNNEMLKRMMEFKGPVPTRMIKSHMRAFETMGGIRPHFTEGGQFMQQEPDPVTGQATVRLVTVTAPSRPMKVDIMRSKGAQDKKDTVLDLADFLDKCMSLDPRQRMSLEQCSAHSFLRRV